MAPARTSARQLALIIFSALSRKLFLCRVNYSYVGIDTPKVAGTSITNLVCTSDVNHPLSSRCHKSTGTEQNGHIKYYNMTSCCRSDTCHRTTYLEVLRSEGRLLRDEHLLPNVARKRLYATYVHAANGVLGRGNRVVVPTCVKDLIREMFPDPQ